MKTMERQRDISMHENTYTNRLIMHTEAINQVYNDYFAPVELLQQIVLHSIDAANDTPAKKRFIANVLKQKTKNDVLTVVWNATLAGCGEAVI